jgi:hypothetical protein
VVLDGDRRLLHERRHLVERDQLSPLVLERVEEVFAGAVVDVRRERDGNGREVVGRGQIRGEVAEKGRRRAPGEDAEGDQDRGQDPRGRAELSGGRRMAPLYNAKMALLRPNNTLK